MCMAQDCTKMLAFVKSYFFHYYYLCIYFGLMETTCTSLVQVAKTKATFANSSIFMVLVFLSYISSIVQFTIRWLYL